MANDEKNEPQSYGSSEEWVKGDTAQTVNRLKGPPNSQHGDFWAERQHGDDSPGPEQGSPDNPVGPARDAHDPVQKVTARESGAKRQSYWKDRDYK